MSAAKNSVKIALLGCGTVGAQVARILVEQRDDLAHRIGAAPELVGIVVRDVDAPREEGVPRDLLTTDADATIAAADVVVEVMGGIEPAKTLILKSLQAGKAVVTANKAVVAEFGPELYEAADAAGADLYFEAAVAGAIPLVRPVRESLAGDRVQRILGIVNGTTNYVLDEMTTRGLDYEIALKQAQELGYAEADPTADVGGFDAAAKAAILASLAFHMRVRLDQVHCEGIESITAGDVIAARESNHVIKLLAIAERSEDGVTARVHPALVADSHPLAGVHGAFNAVFVEAESAGELMFYGQGAGGAPTASAVLGDIVSVARHRAIGGKGPLESAYEGLEVLPIGKAVTSYQVRMEVVDRPGVLARAAAIFADHNVSIETVRQTAIGDGETRNAEVVISTHPAHDADLAACVEGLRGADDLGAVISVLRIEGE